MTDFAQFIAIRVAEVPSVSIGQVTSIIDEGAVEVSRRTASQALRSETEIWNTLLGNICHDAEIKATSDWCVEPHRRIAALTDRDSVRQFDFDVNVNQLVTSACAQFHAQCTTERADLIRLIPPLVDSRAPYFTNHIM
jgi:hypothetical protein